MDTSITPSALQLRNYQQSLIQGVYERWKLGNKRVMAQLPTGGGKSVCFAAIAKDFKTEGVLLIAHRQELIFQAQAHLQRWCDEPVGIIMAGCKPDPLFRIQVASIQTLTRRSRPSAGLIIFDECFPAGTLVDGNPIEKYQVGDYVTAFDEKTGALQKKRVTRVFKNPLKDLVKITLSNKDEIVCTPFHPVFTPEGWKPALALGCRDMMLLANSTQSHAIQHNFSSVQALRKEVCPADVHRQEWTQASRYEEDLQCRMQERHQFVNGVQNESQVCLRQNEEKQPYVASRVFEQNERYIEGHRTQTTQKGRKWKRVDGSANSHASSLRKTMGVGVCSENWSMESEKPGSTAQSLQNRHCEPSVEDCDRSRWAQSSNLDTESPRQEKRDVFDWVGVESVQVYKPGSFRESEPLRSDGFVYNLEVEDWHTYLVDGSCGSYVVHNCHHSSARTYREIINAYPDSYILGVTATPTRADGTGFDDLFESLVCGPTVKQLIKEGHLSKYKLFADANPISTKGVKTTGGDYNQRQLANAVDAVELSGNLIDSYRQYADGKRNVVFAINVEHSQTIAERFSAAGIPAKHVDGKTPDEERKAIMRSFKDGEIQVLVNCNIISEGVDIPAIECVQLARPTKSLSLYLQQVGRALRPAEDKDFAVIIDHTKNWAIFGRPCRDRIWMLEGVKDSEEESKKKQKRKPDGEIVEEEDKAAIVEADANLVEVDESIDEALKFEVAELDKLIEIAKTKQYKNGWVGYRFLELKPSYAALKVCATKLGYNPKWADWKWDELQDEQSDEVCDESIVPF